LTGTGAVQERRRHADMPEGRVDGPRARHRIAPSTKGQGMDLSTNTPHADGPIAAATPAREFLAFRLGADEYGIDILRVQEIRSYERPTRIAHAPEFVKGVVNLRGAIVPIVDLRLMLRLPQAAYDAFTVVVVLHIGQRVIGMVVDAVSDVIALGAEQLRPAPALNSPLGDDHLLAIGTVDERLLVLLDIEKLMTSDALGLVGPTLQ
jgi:purine-binding chemotaxis protein CheW